MISKLFIKSSRSFICLEYLCVRRSYIAVPCIHYIFCEIGDTTEFGPGGIRTHNLLIFRLTTNPSCLGTRQVDSGLPKLLI